MSNLTSKIFLSAFKRFIARRGKPHNAFSDNGINFVGANSELVTLDNFLKDNLVAKQNSSASIGVKWHFIPRRSPNFSGLCEVGVKSIKFRLKRVLPNTLTTSEEFFYSIAISRVYLKFPSINLTKLRPKRPRTFNPRTFSYRTPGPYVSDLSIDRLTRFELLQKFVWDT